MTMGSQAIGCFVKETFITTSAASKAAVLMSKYFVV
jgi:hypothetical protein